MAINTSNNISVISWQSVLLVKETRVPIENHRPVASHNTLKSIEWYETLIDLFFKLFMSSEQSY
jgi:hypothetical protein